VRDLPLLDELAVWLLNNIPESGPVGLIHGDYHLDNTLSHPDRPGLAAVIDWELATIGDPLADLGLFLMFWGPRELDPPGFRHIQAVSRCENVLSRRVLAERWGAATGFPLANLDFYLCFAFWRLAAIVEGAYSLYCQGKVDSDYARGLEYDVPALLEEAAAAARGHW
ncbi:MAG TPA: phosphotransferase family protein, partial [Haliea salexigens]|nr:phosphotransferase family protein [Haliea salexigens]